MRNWTALTILSLFLLVTPAAACPFCNPGESDIFSDIADAQAVVLVQKIDTRKYKVIESLSQTIKPGRIVVAAEPSGKLGKQGHLLLTTAGPPNLPYWSDSPRVLTDKELEFARAALKKSREPKSSQWDFAARNLQDPSSEISSAAYNLLAAAPLTEVQKRARIAGLDNLNRWQKDPKIAAERRALYLLMNYPHLSKSDNTWIEKELFSPNLSPSSPILGPLAVAYLSINGASALPRVKKVFYAPELPASRVTPLNRALTLVTEQSQDQALRSAVKKMFAEELLHPQRGAFVLAPLALWKDETPAQRVEALFTKNEEVTWVKVAVIRYFRSFSSQTAAESLARLSKLDPTLVKRTTDGYRRSDLGVD